MKYFYEFLGTFFLVLTVAMTKGAGLFQPLAVGSMLMVMVFAGGHISGAHYNPAVSLAIYLRGLLDRKDLFMYWMAQLLGAALAAGVSIYLQGADNTPREIDWARTLAAEFLFTFALCFVVLNVATAALTRGNSYFGIAIGFSVLVGAFAIGTISGAALNPAVALGQSILSLTKWSNLWVYVLATLLAGALSSWVFSLAEKEKA